MKVSAPRHKLLKGFQFVACGCYCCTVASPNRRLLLTWATLGSSSAHKAHTHTHTRGHTRTTQCALCAPKWYNKAPATSRTGEVVGSRRHYERCFVCKTCCQQASRQFTAANERVCVCVVTVRVCGCTIDFLLCCNCCFGQVAVASGETDRQAGKAGTAGADVEARNSFACSKRRKTALIQFQLHCRHCMPSVRLLSGHCVAVVVERARGREREPSISAKYVNSIKCAGEEKRSLSHNAS